MTPTLTPRDTTDPATDAMADTMTDAMTDAGGVRLDGRPGIPWSRLLRLEGRKLVDTRSGRWLLIAIGVVTAAALVILVAFGDPGKDTSFASLFGFAAFVQLVLFPLLGVLATTSEFSQRTGLVTFTAEPRRLRVVLAKLVVACGWAMLGLAVAVGLAAVAHAVAVGFRGVPWQWDLHADLLGGFALAQLLGVAQGLGFGLLLTSPAFAIVCYFLLPTLWSVLGGVIPRMERVAPWLDLTRPTEVLTNAAMTGADWAHLGTSSALWVALPLLAGGWLLVRREIS
jgi:ABC-2 type transport system permease protein